MLFNSFGFAIFLVVVFSIYWVLPSRYRWILLLVASYYFYMSWNMKYVFLILFTTGISFIAALMIEKSENRIKKIWILLCTALSCLGVLFYFKYFNFISQSFADCLKVFSIQYSPLLVDVLLPVGISFYTFQTLSYVIDVYRGSVKAEHHFGYYATFISFFPQLVAGPIERTNNLLPQIKAEQIFDYDKATYGLKLMAWGFFKKLCIADVLARYVKMVFDCPMQYHGFGLVLASFFFTVQIYCDFSGYSDIAIGVSKLFGIDLTTNFSNPYLSQSIKEFWSRWHISLSTWFRDYVYIPLGGNRVSNYRNIYNLFITFFLSGLWHGANWTFIVWGCIHGLALAVEGIFGKPKRKRNNGLLGWIRVLFVFCFCGFAWIFFVSKTLPEAVHVIIHVFDGLGQPLLYLKTGFKDLGFDRSLLVTNIITILILVLHDYFSLRIDVIQWISNQKLLIRWGWYISIILFIVIFAQVGTPIEFVYFQF